MSLVVIHYYSLSLVVPLVFIRCHSLSLDVRLAYLFINDQLKKFKHIQIFQLIEINFRFLEGVKFSAITLYNSLISRNQIQLNG